MVFWIGTLDLDPVGFYFGNLDTADLRKIDLEGFFLVGIKCPHTMVLLKDHGLAAEDRSLVWRSWFDALLDLERKIGCAEL